MQSVTSMQDELEWPPFQRRKKELKAVLFYQILHDEVDVTLPLQKAPRETDRASLHRATISHKFSFAFILSIHC